MSLLRRKTEKKGRTLPVKSGCAPPATRLNGLLIKSTGHYSIPVHMLARINRLAHNRAHVLTSVQLAETFCSAAGGPARCAHMATRNPTAFQRLCLSSVSREPLVSELMRLGNTFEEPSSTPGTALPTNASSEPLLRIRHSAAHVLAMAVLKLYPSAKVASGPWTEHGCVLKQPHSCDVSLIHYF